MYVIKTNKDIGWLQESLETYFSNLGLDVMKGAKSNQFVLTRGQSYSIPNPITVSLEYKTPGRLKVDTECVGDILDTKVPTLKIINNMKKIVNRIIELGTVPTESLIPGHKMPQPELKMPQKACKKCGKPIQEDWSICPNCGTQIGIKKLEQTCPNCNKAVKKEWKLCAYCGATLKQDLEPEEEEEEEEHAEEMRKDRCPYCGAKIPAGASYCGLCGREV